MKTDYITLYFSNEEQVAAGEFEEAFYSSLRQYSLRHLPFINDISQENIAEALQKSLQVCRLAGINSISRKFMCMMPILAPYTSTGV
jgi:hypothetical protein